MPKHELSIFEKYFSWWPQFEPWYVRISLLIINSFAIVMLLVSPDDEWWVWLGLLLGVDLMGWALHYIDHLQAPKHLKHQHLE